MKPAFDTENLQQRIEEIKSMHTCEPTKEFWKEEMKRCEDPRYFYNNYWTLPNGKAPRQIFKEEWDARNHIFIFRRSKKISMMQIMKR